MFDVKNFGAYISKMRKQKNMTQSELSDILNVTRQAVSKYENGESFPDISILIQIANTFNISLDNLINAGKPTEAEAAVLENAALNKEIPSEIFNKNIVKDIVNIAPLLKPSVLDNVAAGLAKHDIDISNIIMLAEYLNNESVIKLLENAKFDKLDKELLEKFIPFLNEDSKLIIFEKILNGELDYNLIRTILPYSEYMTSQIEAAVLYGVLDEKALVILKDYFWGKNSEKL